MDEDWISITEAAERLTKAGDVIERSTLSRYLNKHRDALPRQKKGRESLVDYVRLRQHRQENIRIDTQSVQKSAPEQSSTSTFPRRSESQFSGTKVDGAARKSLADAELRELDLAERRHQLTPTSEVDRAGRDAIALMRNAFERTVETESAALSVKYGWDERMVRLALKGFVKSGIDVFHREIHKKLDHFNRVKMAEEQERVEKGDENQTAQADEFAGRRQDYMQ